MNTIETLFVPYELAVKLKELGFDEPCLGNYRLPTNRLITEWEIKNTPENCLGVSAPTFSQAFRWFREKHNMNHSIIFHETTFSNDYQYLVLSNDNEFVDVGYITYEGAELACLKKLIEICSVE